LVQDQDFALGLNIDENLPSQDTPDLPKMSCLKAELVDWDHVLQTTEASTLSNRSCSTITGPSTYYTLRQKVVLEHLPQLKVECSVCGEAVHSYATVRLVCSDIYCKPCLKSFFLCVAKDKSLFLLTCHRQAIDISTIKADFSVEKLTVYQSTKLKFSSMDRVYCTNPECTKFIPMPQQALNYASYKACSTGTCIHCKVLAHKEEYPADKARQSLINFADEQD